MANWKLVGLAGLAGVATVGVVVARRRRTWEEPTAEQLRARLHERLDQADPAPDQGGTGQ